MKLEVKENHIEIFKKSGKVFQKKDKFPNLEILCNFRLVLKGKTGKEIPESSRLEFLEKFSMSNFALSDAEDNTSGSLNKGGITDLPLLRTLLAIRQNSQELSFWEVMDFVLFY